MKIAMKMAAAAFLLLAGCNEKNHDPEAEPALSISPAKESIAFSAAATERYTFEVKTNQPVWFAQSDQTWCEVEMDAEAGTFTVTALENNAETPPPPATILVSAGRAAEIKITATQAGAGAEEPTLAISPAEETLEFSAGATEEFAFTVTTNQPSWTAESDQDWCLVSVDVEAGTFTVTAQVNETTAAPAPATITVSAGNAVPIEITATQQAAEEPTLAISPEKKTLAFSAAATEEFAFSVTTNQSSWTAKSDQPWCLVAVDAEAGTFTVTATANTADTPPAPATITVTAGKAQPIVITATQQAEAGYDIYLAGITWPKSGGGRESVCYWKNGVRTALTSGTALATCNGIVASDGKVYIAGMDGMKSFYSTEESLTYLGADYLYEPKSIAVENGSVYLLLDDMYWNDGRTVEIKRPFTGNAITVTGGDVYLSGQVYLYLQGNDFYLAYVWLNGRATPLKIPVESKYSDALCIASAGGSIYIGGMYQDEKTGVIHPCYWKDGVCTTLELPQGAVSGNVKHICVGEDGTVYAAGYCENASTSDPCYWVGGAHVKLEFPDGAFGNHVTGITVADGKVYMSGDYINLGFAYACYWVDGKRFDLEPEEGVSSLMTAGIALLKR